MALAVGALIPFPAGWVILLCDETGSDDDTSDPGPTDISDDLEVSTVIIQV